MLIEEQLTMILLQITKLTNVTQKEPIYFILHIQKEIGSTYMPTKLQECVWNNVTNIHLAPKYVLKWKETVALWGQM